MISECTVLFPVLNRLVKKLDKRLDWRDRGSLCGFQKKVRVAKEAS